MATDPIPTRSTGWASGPYSDLLFGAGGVYLLSALVITFVAGDAVAADWPLTVTWCIAILVASPHYGATLLRIYEHREERRKYALFAVWATLVITLVLVAALYQPYVGAMVVMVFLTWAPWHFAAQNYGISLMFLRRSGVEITPWAKRLLYASFIFSSALALLALHIAGSDSIRAPARNEGYADLALVSLGIPGPIATVLMLVCVGAYVVALIGSAVLLRRKATLRELLPVASLVLCQALWFTVPSILDLERAWATPTLVFAAIWISGAHSLQYLWITFYYTKRREPGTHLPAYLAKAILAGNAVFVLPGLFFASRLFGADVSFEKGLSALVFSIVNIHHFVLDGAIWKLRDGRVARVLLRGDTGIAHDSAPTRTRKRRWLHAAVWSVFALCVVIEVGELARQQAERHGAYAVVGTLLDGLDWVGRPHEFSRIRIGRILLQRGDYARARAHFERSARDRPSLAAWGGLGRALEGEGDLSAAAEAYEAGLVLDPSDAALLRSAGFTRLRIGQPDRAAEFFERSLEREPGHKRTREGLEEARRGLNGASKTPDPQPRVR
jgi:Tfp pilus assembly protein PilF